MKKPSMSRSSQGAPLVHVVGSLNIDYSGVPEDLTGHHLVLTKQQKGGRAVNHAFQLSRLRATCRVYGSIGDDTAGTILSDALQGMNGTKAIGDNPLYMNPDPPFGRCDPRLKLVQGVMTGITFVSPKPTVQYFHIPGANAVSFADLLTRDAASWNCATCCIADLEIPIDAIQTAFSLCRDDMSPVINVLDASHPAKPVTNDILKVTDVLIVRKKDAAFLLEGDERYTQLAQEIDRDVCDSLENFHDFALRLMNKGPRCVILTTASGGCHWAIAQKDERPDYAASIGRIPSVQAQWPHPNSAHGAFAGTLAYHVARHRLDDLHSKRAELLMRLNWGYICRRAVAAYAVAASKEGASESMPCTEEIDTVFDSMRTGTRTIASIDVEKSTVALNDSTTAEWQLAISKLKDVVSGELHLHRPISAQWLGDGYWIVFDSARNAVLACLAIAKKLTSQGVRFRIGVNTGDVLIGEDQASDGLPASIAKRTESSCYPGVVTISEATRMMLNRKDFEFGELRTAQSKSGEEPFQVCTVMPRQPMAKAVVAAPARRRASAT